MWIFLGIVTVGAILENILMNRRERAEKGPKRS
jgi:hypothetical protein